MARGISLKEALERVRDAGTPEEIASVFADAFGLDAGLPVFARALADLQDGKKASYSKELARYLESLDTETAIEQVGQYFSAAFPLWRGNPQGNLPLLALDRNTGAEIGAKTQIVLLSPDTLRKQDEHHPELTQEDYEKAQEAVQKGEKIRQDARNLAFVSYMPEGSLVIVKATFDGQELYVTSLRRVSRDRAKREEEINRLKRRKSW